eukprot:6179705-Pleurochrysis_carterae.AAC.1
MKKLAAQRVARLQLALNKCKKSTNLSSASVVVSCFAPHPLESARPSKTRWLMFPTLGACSSCWHDQMLMVEHRLDQEIPIQELGALPLEPWYHVIPAYKVF